MKWIKTQSKLGYGSIEALLSLILLPAILGSTIVLMRFAIEHTQTIRRSEKAQQHLQKLHRRGEGKIHKRLSSSGTRVYGSF